MPDRHLLPPHYEGPERRHSQHGRRRYDLPPWVTIIVAALAAVQPIIAAIVIVMKG
jgi:hypothetical protein